MILSRQSKRKIVSLRATKPHGEMVVQLQSLLNTVLDGDKWSSSHPGRFTFGERAPVLFGLEAGRAPEPDWTLWRRDKPLSPTGDRTPIPGSHSS